MDWNTNYFKSFYHKIDLEIILYVRYIKRTTMTHPKNYEYQMRWRARNREQYLKLKMADTLKRYYYKQVIKELYTIDTTLFL